MRIVEVINKITEDSGAEELRDALLTILVNLKSSAESSANPDVSSKVPFSVLSTEMYNVTGQSMDWDAFLTLAQSDPTSGLPGPLDHLISSYNDEEITLNIEGGEEINFSDPENIEEPSQNTVDDMAKRALKART